MSFGSSGSKEGEFNKIRGIHIDQNDFIMCLITKTTEYTDILVFTSVHLIFTQLFFILLFLSFFLLAQQLHTV